LGGFGFEAFEYHFKWPNPDRVAWVQFQRYLRRDALTIMIGSVGTVQVRELAARVGAGQAGVAARNLNVVEQQVVSGLAADAQQAGA
jgi:hypothetical protein